MASLSELPGPGPDPFLRILQSGDPAPVVPGGNVGVANRDVGCGEVTGEREGLQHERLTGGTVEGVEPVLSSHSLDSVRCSKVN